jgi:hypothetical protein
MFVFLPFIYATKIGCFSDRKPPEGINPKKVCTVCKFALSAKIKGLDSNGNPRIRKMNNQQTIKRKQGRGRAERGKKIGFLCLLLLMDKNGARWDMFC